MQRVNFCEIFIPEIFEGFSENDDLDTLDKRSLIHSNTFNNNSEIID